MKSTVTLMVILLLAGCDLAEELCALDANTDVEKVWVFGQFNVPEENDVMDSFYYYGLVSNDLYQKLSNNQITQGFITLHDVRYWGEDDLIYEYKDDEFSGELMFRIEDVRRIRIVNTEPLVGQGVEQFADQAEDGESKPDI